MELERLINIVVTLAVFGLFFSIWSICIILWFGQYLKRVRSVQKKLGISEKQPSESETLQLWRESEQEVKARRSVYKLSLSQRMELLRRAAGWRAPAQAVILGVVGMAIMGFIIAYIVTDDLMLGFCITAGILIAFWTYIQKRIVTYTSLFERQLVDALGIAARALRAGHPLVGAFQLIAEEIDEPVGDVFFRICQEQMLGVDLRDTLGNIAREMVNSELKFFATSVSIQLRSGGNLADLMDSLTNVIRARMRLNRRVRVMTAQTRFSKNTLLSLPIIMFILVNLVNPDYVKPLYTTTAGRIMLLVMMCSMTFGAWVMNKMSVIRF